MTKNYTTKEILEFMGAMEDIIKADESKKIQDGKSDMCNNCYVSSRSLLVVYASEDGIECTFHNFPGFKIYDLSNFNII